MRNNNIVIKGNRDGINIIINNNGFKDFDEMLESLIKRLSTGKMFYKGCTLKITTELKSLNEKQFNKLKNILFEKFLIKDCIFEDSSEKPSKVFSGIYEGRTKFLHRTVRSGQIVNYSGNIVVIGDVNAGSEIYAGGNIIVFGALHGYAHAGFGGNAKAIVASICLQPEMLQIADIVTRSPEDNIKPQYPEVAKIRENIIIVEPYLPNKFI
ncbi:MULTISPECIES: septum site-determining protein MinC [Clostridium]|uniref:Probable septum site-determining protein MinC n=2 Tax=Clostridium TaxID=1485 RepID=D8GNV0_CLOLD|nr:MULTISPECIES: septum site-determining protein MinC [Clostridium]ADK13796.1 predicted septum site-determining protein MinC [Clostridium ljungdahlii DSM 13528]AGY77025.1 septum site-determining protein MinC [Clostridium autoethanogenum DSM 10061]ALU37167.1 Septum site-determining protein minC [Clostridium autoethanogenum DSM 10061]OAA85044.1 putative septum site-determining protein MinC [Clostridium ljungdahlii DSM 13528]OVY50260.1 putative septum site-determining protein MinC [Clostridium au